MVEHRAVHIACTAIQLVDLETSFQLPDLKDQVELEDMPANSTFRRILRQLEEEGWLSRDHPEGRTWSVGPEITDE